MYKILLNILKKLFGLKVEISQIYKRKDEEDWPYSDTSDNVYKIYVTNYKKDKHKKNKRYFGFWVYDENLDKAYKKAFEKTVKDLKWKIKNEFKN